MGPIQDNRMRQDAVIHHIKDRLYYEVMSKMISNETIGYQDRILIVCGGEVDRDIMSILGYSNVVITNLDDRYRDTLLPYEWDHQDAERLTYTDQSFDWVIVHAGLHHCYSPHKALIEMMRVCIRGILIFEGRNSTLIQIAKKLGLVATYELEAVLGNHMKAGGVANTAIPNYVYRWTEEEIRGIVNSYWPVYEDNDIGFYYKLRLPFQRLRRRQSPLLFWLLRGMASLVQVVSMVFPKQGNEFACIIKRGTRLHPWLEATPTGIVICKSYLRARFKH